LGSLYIIAPNKNKTNILKKMIASFSDEFDTVYYVDSLSENTNLTHKNLLVAAELGDNGFDLDMLTLLSAVNMNDISIFSGSTAAILVHSNSQFYTKRCAQSIVFTLNLLGCNFIGHSVVECTGNFTNFNTWKKVFPELSLEEICYNQCKKLSKRLLKYKYINISNPEITVLYSSTHKFSNTLDYWYMVKENLHNCHINEIHIENGVIMDCKGCSYKLCVHYGKQNSCFYGGFMVENVLPAIESADAVVWLCPNYNDALSANLTATINRLTVLYNKMNFYDKSMFGIVVSGNSGSDSVGKQLIGALNINKGFRLPPNALLYETANDPKAIYSVKSIYEKAKDFALNMINNI
jgi:multimeric flavodoxin WrbA